MADTTRIDVSIEHKGAPVTGETWTVNLPAVSFAYQVARDDSLADVGKALAALINHSINPGAADYVASVEGNSLVIVKTSAGGFTADVSIAPATGSSTKELVQDAAPQGWTALLAGTPLVGEIWRVALDGFNYTHTVVAGETVRLLSNQDSGAQSTLAAADLLADLPKETSEELLEEMPGQEADEVRELLAFDPSTAGGMMNTEFVFVGEQSRREEVLAWIRGLELNLDQLDTIVLLDEAAEYSGTVSVARLLMAAPEQMMLDLRSEPLLSIAADADEKDVFELFDKYNLRMLTVVDEEMRPIGTVTVDDVVSRLVKK